jgi:hypothetical protein
MIIKSLRKSYLHRMGNKCNQKTKDQAVSINKIWYLSLIGRLQRACLQINRSLQDLRSTSMIMSHHWISTRDISPLLSITNINRLISKRLFRMWGRCPSINISNNSSSCSRLTRLYPHPLTHKLSTQQIRCDTKSIWKIIFL